MERNMQNNMKVEVTKTKQRGQKDLWGRLDSKKEDLKSYEN